MKKKSWLRKHLKRLEPVRDRYMFTDNRHPERGIMSAALGVISVSAVVCAIVFTFRDGGTATMQNAAAAFVAAIFSVVGIVLGIRARFEKDIFKFFPNLGIILNSLVIIFTVIMLLAGFGVIFFLVNM